MREEEFVPELFYLEKRHMFITRIVRPRTAILYIISRRAMEEYLQSLEWEAMHRNWNH